MVVEPVEALRCGFVGIGGRGGELLGAALENRRVEVAAVCDTDPRHLREAADRVERESGTRPATFDDYLKFLEAPGLHTVVSATPCHEHFRIYRDTVAAGKHLYGERPLCLSVDEADELVARADAAPGLKVQIGFQKRSNRRYIEGVKLIREDRILGDLIDGRASFNNHPGGDWMIEQAVHTWDVLNWVAGTTPLRAFALGHRGVFRDYDPDRNVTDYYCAILEYPGKLTVEVSHSWNSPDDMAFRGVHERFIGLRGGIDLGAGKIVYSERSGVKPAERNRRFQRDVADDTVLSLNSFFDCVEIGQQPNATVRHGRDATLVGLLVRKAVYEKRTVTWEEMLETC